MPELPEVETVRKQLYKEFIGDVVGEIEVRKEKIFQGDPEELRGEKVVDVTRHGKWLLIHFASGKGMESHLRMTGRLVMDDEYDTMPHTRVVVNWKSGKKLYYWDTRMFGYLRVVSSVRETQKEIEKKLGPEPFDMNVDDLMVKLKKTSRKIKDVIIDQSIMAGVGNIYANDALWLSRILPTRKANGLSKKEAESLLSGLVDVLNKGLETGGASDNTYRDMYGEKGGYQKEFLVYGGGKCSECGRELRYSKVSGRGTWHCENRQR